MSEIQARLVVQRGPNPGSAFELLSAIVKLGRSASNDLVINDPEMSRQHAQFLRHGDGYVIQDLGSTNGTFVNYQRVTGATPLSHGDVISFGEAIVLTYWDDSATDSQPVPPPTFQQQPPAATAVPTPPDPIIQTVPPPTPPQPSLPYDSPPVELAAPPNRRRWLVGCGLAFLLIICLCMGTLFFLDSYQQGRLLYCGGLRPFWQFLLGPFGFNPAC